VLTIVVTQTLQKLGRRDGQNLRLDVRWSAGDPQLIRYYADELVAITPDLIVTSSTANLAAVLRDILPHIAADMFPSGARANGNRYRKTAIHSCTWRRGACKAACRADCERLNA
jgi:hypothetical protein